MSKQEAVSAFLKGSIGRREFVQRLGIAGVSATAAVAYANALRPSSASAAGGASGAAGLRRAFQDDDYAGETEVPTEVPGTGGDDVTEAISAVLTSLIDDLTAVSENSAAIIADLGITGPIADDFESNINQVISNLQSHLGAIGASVAPGASGVRALQADASTIEDIAAQFDDVAGGLAGLVQSGNVEFSSIAIVAGRHAAYFHALVGGEPFPNSEEPPVDAADIG